MSWTSRVRVAGTRPCRFRRFERAELGTQVSSLTRDLVGSSDSSNFAAVPLALRLAETRSLVTRARADFQCDWCRKEV